MVFPRSIRYLLAVAEHRSFTRAAETLHVSQPALSQRIKQLEEALETQLFDRSDRVVKLTAAGAIYLRHARGALKELDAGRQALAELEALSRGSLRVGVTPITAFLATPLLEEFNARHPGIALGTLEMSQEDIDLAVAEDRIDVGILFNGGIENELCAAKVDPHILFVETLCLAVGDEHPSARSPTALGASVLETQPLAMLSADFALRRHFDRYCTQQGIQPRVAMEANALSVIVELVRLGRFVTVLPEPIACSQHGIRPVALRPELPSHAITLVCRKGAYKSAACRAFGELASHWSTLKCQRQDAHRMRPCPLSEICTDGVSE